MGVARLEVPGLWLETPVLESSAVPHQLPVYTPVFLTSETGSDKASTCKVVSKHLICNDPSILLLSNKFRKNKTKQKTGDYRRKKKKKKKKGGQREKKKKKKKKKS